MFQLGPLTEMHPPPYFLPVQVLGICFIAEGLDPVEKRKNYGNFIVC
jgi:hypothetical protein